MVYARQPLKLLALSPALALGLAFAAVAMKDDGANAADPPPALRVLIFSGLNNHDWRSTTPVIKQTLQACSRFSTVDVTDDPASIDAPTLARYDVVVSNWTPYPDVRRTWRPETENAFLDFVRNGGGFVVVHAAACTFQVWPEFQQLIALTWKADHTAHGAYHTFRVSVEEPQHPIAQGLTDFYTTDELYHNMVSLSDRPLRVVFKAFSAKDKGGTGKFEPALVCTEMGRGRGVNLVLGHDAPAMTAAFKVLLLRSTEWAATGKVTIPPPTIWPTTPAAMAAADIDVGATLDAVAHYQYGNQRKSLDALRQLVVYASHSGDDRAREFRFRLADRMASLLNSKETTPAAKAFLCGQLATIASEKQAPALASLLGDSDSAPAALSALALVPGRTVDQILRESLGTLQGDLKIGAVGALGERRDLTATKPLIDILTGADEATACAAASALGKIGGDAAVAALQQALANTKGRLRTEVAQACLRCADRMLFETKRESAAKLYAQLSLPGEAQPVRAAALRGTVLANPDEAARALTDALTSGNWALENMALELLPQVPGSAATLQFAQCFSKLPPTAQARLLVALAARGDAAARDAAEAAVSSADQAVRIAALDALGTCGDETSLRTLVAQAVAYSETAEADAARRSLVRLRGPRVNEVLIAMIPQCQARNKVELIRVLAARSALSATAQLMKTAEDPDPTVRKESWRALGRLATAKEVASLLDLLVRARDDDRDDAEKTVGAVLRRPDRPDLRPLLEKLEALEAAQSQCRLIRIVSAVGDEAGLPALRKAVQSADPGVRDAAIRGLAAWPTAAPFDDLLHLARHAEEPVHRVLALRAAMRLWSKVEGRTPQQMTGFVNELMPLCSEIAERKAVLAELGRCATPDAFHLARKYVDDPQLATEAGVAMAQIASALKSTHRDEVLKALRPILLQEDPAVVGRAAKVLNDILKPKNLALDATATSPDGLNADGAAGGDRAAIDGDANTYWDEVDGANQYRLKLTFPRPTDVASVNIVWHPFEQHQAKDFDVVCDGKVVKQVRNGQCFENEMFLSIAPVRCTSVELVIPGKNGLVSPCIHELQVFAPGAFADNAEQLPGKIGKQ